MATPFLECERDRIARAVLTAWVMGAILLVPTFVHASDSFPRVVRTHWSVGALPVAGDGCRLCHSNDDGIDVTQRFGQVLYEARARKKDDDSLRRALDLDRANSWDSDGDKVTDYQEVRFDGTNPNDPKDFTLPPPPVSEGGAGGEGGGGDTGAQPPPSFPGLAGLPPPLQHGCSTSAPAPAGPGSAVGLVVLAWLFASRRGRRSAR